jgi:hypothetical protein
MEREHSRIVSLTSFVFSFLLSLFCLPFPFFFYGTGRNVTTVLPLSPVATPVHLFLLECRRFSFLCRFALHF